MQALILAAGMGRRLGEMTKDNTKCMVEVNGKSIIEHMLEKLMPLKLSNIIIVIGYEAEKLKRFISERFSDLKITYVINPIYDKTNNIYSLLLAKDYLVSDDTILLESDLIFEDSILKKLIDNTFPNLALVDKYESWMDGTVVKIDDNNNIKSFISKKYFDWEEIPEYFKTVNIYKLSKEFLRSHYVPMLEAYCKALGHNEYYEQVLKVIANIDNISLKALPLDGEKWYEIDDIQDLDIAESLFAINDDEQWKAYTFRYGGYWRYPKLLDFCYLVNPYFPPSRMINEMKSNFEILLREYPSGMNVNSMLAAKYFGLNKNNVVVGNGAAELIKAYVENNVKRLGVVFPTFEEYPNRLNIENIVKFIPSSDGFRYSVNDYINYFSKINVDTLLLINPDNPSGNYVPYNDLLLLIEWTKNNRKKLIIDESFVDFADVKGKFSLLEADILRDNPHLVVLKSISKSYGVPGLRLGILASGDTELISKLKKNVSIWNVNSFGEFYMQIFSKYESDYKLACKQFINERESFQNKLEKISYLRIFPSQANYFLCEVIGGMKSRDLAIKLLKNNNILIKDCSAKEAIKGKQYIRIAVRDTNDNNKIIEKLKEYENN